MFRTIQITVDAASWTTLGKAVPTTISAAAGSRRVRVDMALLHTALRSRPPSYQGLHIADFWAWLRYFPAVSTDPNLSLRSEWDELDAHQKTILSDDWGVGFSTGIIGQLLGVLVWADTSHVAKLTKGWTPPLVTLTSTNKKGPKKSPDFLGFTAGLDIVVLECKGTQSGSEVSTKQIGKGVAQKQAISFSGVTPLQSLVGGLYIPLETNSAVAEWQVRDPEPGSDGSARPGAPLELAKAILRSEICGFLKMMGLARLAELLDVDADGGGWPTEWRARLPPFVDTMQRNEVNYVGVTRSLELPRGTRIGDTECQALDAYLMISANVLDALAGPSLDKQLRGLVDRVCRHAEPPSWSLEEGEPDGGPSHEATSVALETPSGLRVEVTWR